MGEGNIRTLHTGVHFSSSTCTLLINFPRRVQYRKPFNNHTNEPNERAQTPSRVKSIHPSIHLQCTSCMPSQLYDKATFFSR